MKSLPTLGLIFFLLPVLCVFATPDAKLSPVGIGLVAMLTIVGVLVILKLRVAYYLGLASTTIVVMSGIVGWAGIGGHRFGLPIPPVMQVVVGCYICFRVALAHRMFGPQPARKRIAEDHNSDDDSYDDDVATA